MLTLLLFLSFKQHIFFLKLQNHIDSIRATYTKNFTAKDVAKKQIAVATYLIDKLALRAGNEKVDFDFVFAN